jgi:peroxiredoxin
VLRQNGRILLRLEALERRVALREAQVRPAAAPAPDLPVGARAPDFHLASLRGGRRRLSDWRGRRVLLIFFDPRCGFCSGMVPDLAALPSDPISGHPVPVVVTTGSADENRKLFQEHGLRCPVLLQDGGDLPARYGAAGTPMGYLLDEEGRIASEMAVGAEALLALAAPGGGAALAPERPETGDSGHRKHRGNRSLSESRLNRSGLAAGTPAPSFRAPRLDAGELSLEEYRGRRLLLVFSDPHCGPCDALAPRLEQAQRARGDVQVVMVSRGDLEENRRKAAELGLSFPIGVQRQWEISKLYAMFATPIAYLIDGAGVIASEVAVGVEPILGLLVGPENPGGDKGPDARRVGATVRA